MLILYAHLSSSRIRMTWNAKVLFKLLNVLDCFEDCVHCVGCGAKECTQCVDGKILINGQCLQCLDFDGLFTNDDG